MRTPVLIERREWTIESDVHAITPIVETVQALCRAAGFSPRQCRLNIPVAITEALSNAILRGNGCERERRVHITAALETQRLIVEVSDEGGGFDLDAAQGHPDDADWLEREDGRGLFLMRSLMDHVENLIPGTVHGHTLRLILQRA
ncbi:MAG: ATP-binding protein [Gemmatimonadaceae bacterium]|nr:ATP-binding protein [Gemmatimonadaceae bacterium]